MKHLQYFLLSLIFPMLVAACGAEESTVPQTAQGPALIMFYTDN
jgi:hypothetical protein